MALRNAGLQSSRNLKNLKELEACLTRPATLQAGGGGFKRSRAFRRAWEQGARSLLDDWMIWRSVRQTFWRTDRAHAYSLIPSMLWHQDGPSWPQDGPRWPPRWPKMGPGWPQDGTKMAQDGPKMAPRWPQDACQNERFAWTWPQDGPE